GIRDDLVTGVQTCALPISIASDVLVPIANGGTVPLGEVASIKLTRGATTIRTENGQLALYIFVDIRDRDLGGYVTEAQKAVAARSEERRVGKGRRWRMGGL